MKVTIDRAKATLSADLASEVECMFASDMTKLGFRFAEFSVRAERLEAVSAELAAACKVAEEALTEQGYEPEGETLSALRAALKKAGAK